MSATVTKSLVRWCRCGEWEISDRPRAGLFRCRGCAVNTWPRTERCARCGDEVLLARHVGAGRPFILEAREVFPLGTCGSCRGRGTVRVRLVLGSAGTLRGGAGLHGGGSALGAFAGRVSTNATAVACYACKGAKVRGEEIPADAVAVGPNGIGRRLERDGKRRPGEAIHRRHRCSRPPAP